MSDIFIRSARITPLVQIPFRLMMGITRPRAPIVGFVFSGVIDQVGASITRFKRGDEVYCTTGFSLGAYAEYRCMVETDSKNHGCLALKPHNLTTRKRLPRRTVDCSPCNTPTRAELKRVMTS